MGVVSSQKVSEALLDEFEQALKNPREIFGYAHFGERWPKLNHMTAGIQPHNLSVLVARPKVGKSMLAAGWVPAIAEQAVAAGQVLRIITLETTKKSYQRRAAAIMARIPDPMNIRRGMGMTEKEQKDYRAALQYLAMLPIEYLSNDRDLEEVETYQAGASGVSYDMIQEFVEQDDTFWWLLDHIGLVSDLSNTSGDNMAGSLFKLANRFSDMAHRGASGMLITHLTRASIGGGVPGIESIAGSDQIGRNAEQIYLLWRPFFEARNLEPEDREMMKVGDPALLQYYSRDEGGGLDVLWWDAKLASFSEMDIAPGTEIPMPVTKKAAGKTGASKK